MFDKGVHPLLLSGKIGDGGIARNKTRVRIPDYSICFVSINLDYLQHKREALKHLHPGKITLQNSGYKKGATSFKFQTRQHPDVSRVAEMSILETVEALTREAFVYYYLDDGTYHQRKHFMHLYCNTFDSAAVSALIEKVYALYPQKVCTLRWDRKKDGRAFPYLYIPVVTAKAIATDVARFLYANRIHSLLYKTGNAVPPSETIESHTQKRETEALG